MGGPRTHTLPSLGETEEGNQASSKPAEGISTSLRRLIREFTGGTEKRDLDPAASVVHP